MTKDKPIDYSELYESVDRLDKGRPVFVLLSPVQAHLFERHLQQMCRVSHGKGLGSLLDSIGFAWLQMRIAVSHPKLLELGHYYELDDDTLNRVRFDVRSDGKVLVTFLPRFDARS